MKQYGVIKNVYGSLKQSKTFPGLRIENGFGQMEQRFMKKKLCKTLTIKNIQGVISDENVDIIITFNNNTRITSNYSRVTLLDPKSTQVWDMGSYHGSTGSVIGDVLLCYAQNNNLKIN